jgi:hypothetical protein
MGRMAKAADRLPSQRKRDTAEELEQQQQGQQQIDEEHHARKKINQEQCARARADRLRSSS